MTRSEAITRMCEAAVSTEKATGCPAELLVAQAILESDWGKSMPGFNMFGFKNYPGSYGRQLLKTRERFTDAELKAFLALNDGRVAELEDDVMVNGRKGYRVLDWFATFQSLEACFAKRAQRWNAGQGLTWVKAFRVNRDFAAMFAEMARSYATADPNAYALALLARLKVPEVQEGLAAARLPKQIPT